MKPLTLLTFCAIVFISNAQMVEFDRNINRQIDTIYNYFTSEFVSDVYDIGRVRISPVNLQQSLFHEIVDTSKNIYTVHYSGKIVFQYELSEGKINGMGYCYYSQSGNVAIQAEFKNDKLDGFVYVHDENGRLIEIMKFRNGKYKRHIYDFQIHDKKGLRMISKNRSSNPLRNNEAIIVFKGNG